MAISNEQKKQVVAQYEEWIERSKALIVTQYVGLSVKNLDALREKVREAGGEFHIVKNTLGQIAFESTGIKAPEGMLEGSTAIGFAFEDAPALAKALNEFSKDSDFLKLKGGFLGTDPLTADEIKALADLPPLPVMRAQLLGTILAPASKLVRTLAEPGRSLAAVLQAYVDKDAAPEAA